MLILQMGFAHAVQHDLHDFNPTALTIEHDDGDCLLVDTPQAKSARRLASAFSSIKLRNMTFLPPRRVMTRKPIQRPSRARRLSLSNFKFSIDLEGGSHEPQKASRRFARRNHARHVCLGTRNDEIIVLSSPFKKAATEVISTTEILTAEEIEGSIDGPLGNLLDSLPGVSSAGYGPAVGQPSFVALAGIGLMSCKMA